jgi:hypothetical protein
MSVEAEDVCEGEDMKLGRRQVVGLVAVFLLTLGSLSCGNDQSLSFIEVRPTGTTITGAGLDLQFTAIGHYNHPPTTKDITSQVIWKSAAQQVIDFITPAVPGLATSGFGCGTNIPIQAIVYRNPKSPSNGTAIIGTASVSVSQGGTSGC